MKRVEKKAIMEKKIPNYKKFSFTFFWSYIEIFVFSEMMFGNLFEGVFAS